MYTYKCVHTCTYKCVYIHVHNNTCHYNNNNNSYNTITSAFLFLTVS